MNMPIFDSLYLGEEVSRLVRAEVSRIPISERGVTVRSRYDDETRHVDNVADTAVKEYLEQYFKEIPGVGVVLISEEHDQPIEIVNGPRRVYTVLDPVDGSLNSISNIGISTCNWATTEPTDKELKDLTLGDFTFGLIGHLHSSETYMARNGEGAYKKTGDHTRRVSAGNYLDPKKLRFFLDPLSGDRERALNTIADFLNSGLFYDYGRFYGCGFEISSMVAPKEIPTNYTNFLGLGEKVDNVLAGKILVKEAGGISSDWDGKPLDDYPLDSKPDVVISANEELHKRVLNRLDEIR